MVAINKPKKNTLNCLLGKKEKIGYEISRNWIVSHCIYFNSDKENLHPFKKIRKEKIGYAIAINWIVLHGIYFIPGQSF